MKVIFNFLIVAMWFALVACSDENTPQISVTNPSDQGRTQVVRADISELQLSAELAYDLIRGAKAHPSEWIDINDDGILDHVLFEVDLTGSESQEITIEATESPLEAQKRTQAELSVKEGGTWNERKYEGGTFQNVTSLTVPEEHTDHSNYIRYEGPGWESDVAAYRYYLDWRNGVDFFGKQTTDMVLQNVGMDGFSSYHELADWGMDLLKVGPTIGLASLGRYLDDSLYRFQQVGELSCEITRDGLLYSEVTTNYQDWQTEEDTVDLQSVLGIRAGSALTIHDISFSQPISGFCTGLVISEGEEYVNKEIGDYQVLATYGGFSLNEDKMGLGLIVPSGDVETVTDGAGSHLVIFKPGQKITYHFMAAWEKDPSAVQSMDELMTILKAEISQLAQPLEVKVSQ